MSNHLAVATVTAALRYHLDEELKVDPKPKFTHSRPVAPSTDDPVVNIFLYRVSPNHSLTNVDLPTRSPRGKLVMRPSVALELHYLLTFYGSERDLLPQRIMGDVVRALESKPILHRERVKSAIEEFQWLNGSDLAQAVEPVRFVPEALSLEEMSRLWALFADTPYALSVAYRASVVTIEAEETTRQVLPVAERRINVTASATGAARITPSDIPDLQLWLASDRGLTYDNHGVSRWEDQSGHQNHALQGASAHRPAFVAHGIADKPVLRFDGLDDYLAIDNLSYAASGEISEITVCALVKSSSSGPQIIASFDREEYWRLTVRDGVDAKVGWDTTDSTGTVHDLRSKDSFVDGKWHLMCASFNAAGVPDKRLFIDGTDAGTELSTDTAHAGNSLGRGNARFGFIGVGSEASDFDGSQDPPWHFHGDIAELLIYHHLLSDEQRGQLEMYFVNRYRQ